MSASPPANAPPARIRTLIADDEPTACRGVRLLLGHDPEIEIVAEASDGVMAAELIQRLRPDLVLLDVQMPRCDGFEVLARLDQAQLPVVVFVTAYDEHALRAFEVNAVDYLLKPYEDGRFAAAVMRAKQEVRRRHTEAMNVRLVQLLEYLRQNAAELAAPPATGGGDRILVKSSGEIFFLKAEEIDWIEAEGDYMKFHVAGRSHLMRETMQRLEARLDSRRFVRIHRSTIVNIDRVRKLSPSFAGEYVVMLHDGTKLKLSRGYHDRLAAHLRQSL